MEQQPLMQRLKKIRERCLDVPGGIKAVAKSMGRAENTLHNWFKGATNPTVEDVELLKEKVGELEEAGRLADLERQARLNAALA